MKKIAIFTGAGVSAESGVPTFRGGGLWDEHKIEDVATLSGWKKDRERVLRFYNELRAKLVDVEPNAAHTAIAKLEDKFEVCVITQNVDDLHERGGSTNVIHLHGSLLEARSTADHTLVYPWSKDINIGDKCEKGSQLRPNIVWFGEDVPLIQRAILQVADADVLLVIGTSLQVYPAANLANAAGDRAVTYYIDPNAKAIGNVKIIQENATVGVPFIVEKLLGQ